MLTGTYICLRIFEVLNNWGETITTIHVSDDITETTKQLRVPSGNSPPKNTIKETKRRRLLYNT